MTVNRKLTPEEAQQLATIFSEVYRIIEEAIKPVLDAMVKVMGIIEERGDK